MVRARWAGVARRTGANRGRAVIVEGARGSNVGITSGERPGIVDPIGPLTRRWLSGGLEDAGLSAAAFLATFDRIEAVLGDDCEIEWAWDDAGLVVLQARVLPSIDEPTAPAEVIELWQELGPVLAPGPADRVALDRGSLADLASPPARATVELLDAIWRDSPRVPTRVVRLGGAAWFLRTPGAPLGEAVRGPARRVGRVAARMTAERDVDALACRVADLETGLPASPLPAGGGPVQAAEVLARRQALLAGPGRLAREVAELAATGSAKAGEVLGDGVAGDGWMSALASAGPDGVDMDDLARTWSFRGQPDLSLEVPRIGEGRFALEPPAAPSSQHAGGLRGRARVALAWHAWRLREAMLALGDATGRTDVFEWSTAEIERLADSGELPPRSAEVGAPTDALPSQLDVAGLEAWVATGRPTQGSRRGEAVSLLGAPPAWEGVLGDVGELRDGAVRLAIPDPAVIVRLEPGCQLLIAHGAELSHGALLARARGLTGFMGLGPGLLEVPEGIRLRIEADGSWGILSGADPSSR